MTVILGTLAHATAVTILAPSLAIPPASYSLPTMKPEMERSQNENVLQVPQGTCLLRKCVKSINRAGFHCMLPWRWQSQAYINAQFIGLAEVSLSTTTLL